MTLRKKRGSFFWRIVLKWTSVGNAVSLDIEQFIYQMTGGSIHVLQYCD